MFNYTIETKFISSISVVATFYRYEAILPTPKKADPIQLTSHAIVRWAERFFNLDSSKERTACAYKWGYRKAGFMVTDGILDKWLKSNWKDYRDCVRTLRESIDGRSDTFEEHGYTFVIRDGALVTVYEKGYHD